MNRLELQMTTEEHQLFEELISGLVGLSFAGTKRDILESRLRPRLHALQLPSFMDYYLLLECDVDDELDRLAHLVTNNETYFFRETRQFEAMFEEVIDEIRAPSGGAGQVRVLCAGCSSGEEPYTLKILSEDHAARLRGSTLTIDAFDVDLPRLETARRAEYGQNSLRATSERQIQDHFQRSGSHLFRLAPRYQEGVNLSHGNILETSTYPSRRPYDAIYCRNVLIYFSESALRRAILNFVHMLRRGGFLFLGHAESIIGITPALETVRLSKCIAYRKTGESPVEATAKGLPSESRGLA